MKERLGNIWTETDSRGVLKIGFSREYIESKLGECFHVMQADIKFARKGCPLLVLETNDGTERVKSPITGTILTFNGKAANFPDRLVEEDTIVEVLPEGVKLATIKTAQAKPTLETFEVGWGTPFEVNQAFNNPPPPPVAGQRQWNLDPQQVQAAVEQLRRRNAPRR